MSAKTKSKYSREQIIELMKNNFPSSEVFIDCDGKERVFEYLVFPSERKNGLIMTAEEKNKELGYEFTVYSKKSTGNIEYHHKYLIGEFRKRIRKSLSVKYLQSSDHHQGGIVPSHDVIKGRIEYSRELGDHGLVIDGEFITYEQFNKILQVYEGWNFELKIKDPGEEL